MYTSYSLWTQAKDETVHQPIQPSENQQNSSKYQARPSTKSLKTENFVRVYILCLEQILHQMTVNLFKAVDKTRQLSLLRYARYVNDRPGTAGCKS